jgi:hypothetical protein
VPFQPPVFYREKVYIQSDNGTSTVKSYDGSSNAAAASGSPPAGMFAVAWKDHLVLARNSANPNRMWFSNGGDAGTWDTAADGQWLDLTYIPNGLAAYRGMIFSFSENAIERIRGDIIPGVSGSDIVKEVMFNVGCPDPAAIAVSDDYVAFANVNGAYLTDGIGLIDLTDQCGIKSLWRDRTANSLFNFIGGLYQGYYIVSIYSGSSFYDSFCFDIPRRRAWRFTNITAAMMVTAPTSSDSLSGELFFGQRDQAFVSRLGTMFSPTGFEFAAGDPTDGNATYPSPSVTTGYLRGRPGKKRWRRLYVSYQLSDPGTENPTITAGWKFNPTLDSTAGTSTIAETTAASATMTRTPVPITGNPQSEGISVSLTGTNVHTDDFRLYSIEAEVRELEQSR